MITENIDTLKIQKLSEEQFEREKAAGRIDETSIYLTDEKEVEVAKRLSEVDKADWVDDGVPQWWIDTEITAEEFSRLTGGKYSFTKSKGSGYAYDFGYEFIRLYIEHSRGRGQYNKYALTVGPNPVPDPDFKDWDIVRDESGAIISMAPLRFNDSVPMRLGEAGHLRGPAELSAYEALTGSARLMALLSYGAASEKFATKDELSAIPKFEIKVVTALPTSNISETTLYLVKATPGETNDLYDEYIYVNGVWEHLGTAKVDLSEYVKSVSLAKVATSGAYADLNGCPTVPSALSQLTQTAQYRTVTDTEKAAWNAKSDFDGKYSSLTGKPTIPTTLSQLSQTASYRTVTDTEKAAWNAKMGEGTKYYLGMGDTLETGLWYIELAGTVSHTYGRVYCPLGVVRVDAGTKIIYCPTFDRDFVLYNGGQEIAITQHNTLTNDYGNVSQVIAYRLS